MAALLASAYLNAHREKNAAPVELPMPWNDVNPADEVTDEERAEARAKLLRYSAFAN